MSKSFHRLFMVLLISGMPAVFSACGKDPVPFHLVNYGDLCLSTGAGGGIEAETPLNVTVTFDWTPDCGDRYSHSLCDAILDGQTLTVTSATTFEPGPPDWVCLQAPPPEAVHCAGPPLSSGEYTVRHGSESFSLTVPSDSPAGVCSAEG